MSQMEANGKYYEKTFTSVPIDDNPDIIDEIFEYVPSEYHQEITQDLVYVIFIDPIWGRSTYLFDLLVKTLQ